MKFLAKILATYNYQSFLEFANSLFVTNKYKQMLNAAPITAFLFPAIDRIFGLDAIAFSLMLIVFVFELASGIYAAHIKKEEFSSAKLSRFTFKTGCYMVLIAVPYALSMSFQAHGKTAAAMMFDWLHLFFVAQVILENIFSILENLAVIDGKPKTHWITIIQEKIKNLLS